MTDKPTRAAKTPSLINRSGVRKYLLDYAARNRAHTFARVSPDVYSQIEAGVRELCRKIVETQPSVGKTIR